MKSKNYVKQKITFVKIEAGLSVTDFKLGKKYWTEYGNPTFFVMKSVETKSGKNPSLYIMHLVKAKSDFFPTLYIMKSVKTKHKRK